MPFKVYKGGKLDPVHKPEHVALSNFLDRATMWPQVPATGWEAKVPKTALSVLGNDMWGNCAAAGALGLAQVQSANAGTLLVPTTKEAIGLYSAVTGFDPNAGPPGDNPTDNGTVLTSLLNYWQQTGIIISDVNGKETLHQIVGWATLDISSVAQMRWAAFTFGGAYQGIKCPEKCEEDTNNWNFSPGLPIAGGHCIVQAGEGSLGGKSRSWGMFIPTSTGFYSAYLDESHIVVTKDWLNAQEKSPSGLDLDGMLAAMKAITTS